MFTIGGFYRPPNADRDYLLKFYNAICGLSPNNIRNLVICGDFNIDYCSKHDPVLTLLETDFGLTQVVSEKTRIVTSSSSLIDLVFVSNSIFVKSCEVLAPVSNSDHNSILVKFHLPSRFRNSKQLSKQIWIYNQANVDLACQLLKDLPIAPCDGDMDSAWKSWSTYFLHVMSKCIPSKRVPLHSNHPWITKEIISAIRKRELLYRKFKRSKCIDFLVKFKSLRNRILLMIRSSKKTYFKTLAFCKNNSKKFWSIINKVKPHLNISTVLVNDTVTATTDAEKANLLNEYFTSCFNTVQVCQDYVLSACMKK